MTAVTGAVVCAACRKRATKDPSGLCRGCLGGAPVAPAVVIPAPAAPVSVARPLAAVHAAPPATENPINLMWLGSPLVAFVVYGEPGSQGSKNKGEHGNLYEASKKVRPWRDDVRDGFLAVRPPDWVPLDGAVVLDLVVSIRRPVSEPKTIRTFPAKSPDWDKIKRSTNDALKTAGLWSDDGRLVGYRRSFEVYAGDPDPDALTSPGAVIRAWLTPREPRIR